MPDTKRTLWRDTAVLAVVVGVVLLLINTTHLFPRGLLSTLLSYWPVLFIAAGVLRLLSGRRDRRAEGLLYLGAGAFLQLMTLDWIPGGFEAAWPLGSLLLGLWILFRPDKFAALESAELLTLSEFLSDRSFEVNGPAPPRVECDCIFSTLTLRLPAAGSTVLAVDCWFSALTVRLPDETRVRNTASLSLGRLVDRRRRSAIAITDGGAAGHELVLEGRCGLSVMTIKSLH
jgi:hypothetical protein